MASSHSMLLDLTHNRLGWPARQRVLAPPGAGPSMYARLVQSKLGRTLAERADSRGVEVGILAADPSADATEAPLAVVCEFPRAASDGALEQAHHLAWNFCRSPLLLTLEPHLIRAWSSCERPRDQLTGSAPDTEVTSLQLDPGRAVDFSSDAARALSWVSLISGQLIRKFPDRFPRKNCADQTLLDNLRAVRELMLDQQLPPDVVHDLLARLMFVQFLFDRKDDEGRAALTTEWLRRQHERGKLSTAHDSLESVLRNADDAYALFRLLNRRFNGDLFPGKAADKAKREAEWRREKELAAPHLGLLADFVGGKLQFKSGQRSLWPLYAFDVIPLEFISSVYETFINKDKSTHYTPAHVVDFVLDTCLPWNDNAWNLKVLDGGCGSGIFLVKAFQRIVYRWRRAHRFRKSPGARVLRKLLSDNFVGVDIQPEAVRVASFSLYLAMCDEIEPRHVWDTVKFPPLRGRSLIASDFFREDQQGFRSMAATDRYDVVVGNAPWGTGTMTGHAKKWARNYGWSASYENIGPLFLAKGARLAKPGGYVSMLQPAGLLFGTIKGASVIRRRLLERYKMETIINLSALRFGLFKDAVAPACVFCLRSEDPDGEPLEYASPKSSRTSDDDFRIVFDAHDRHLVSLKEALHDPSIFTSLMWGGRRDHELVTELAAFPTLEGLEEDDEVQTRQGIIRGSQTKRQDQILNRPMLDAKDFPAEGFPFLDPSRLRPNQNPMTDAAASTDFSAFAPPQLIIKSGWKRSSGRFQARIVTGDGGVLCSESYVTVHFAPARRAMMEAACAAYNSKLASYFLLHTSSRFGPYIQESNKDELLRVPLPNRPVEFERLRAPGDADEIVQRAFGLKPVQWMLVEDAFRHTLSAFKSESSRAKHAAESAVAARQGVGSEMLAEYGEAFGRVMRAGFGRDKRVRTTVFRTTEDVNVPAHLVAIHLDWPGPDGVAFEDVTAPELLARLVTLSLALEQQSEDGTTLYRRVARVYDVVTVNHVKVPTVYLCKPNLPRYWTRSMGLRDADEVSADLDLLAKARRPSRRAVGA